MTTTGRTMQTPSAAYLSLEGEEGGRPEGPAYRASVEAINAIARTLRTALERMGRPAGSVGSLQRLYTMRRDVQPPTWHWKLLIRVPSCVSTTLVEFAKHLSGTQLPVMVVRVPRRKRVKPQPAHRAELAAASAA